MGTSILVIFIVLIGLAVVIGLWGVGIYNGLVKLRNLVQEAWRQIDVELTRRHDLIGNLVGSRPRRRTCSPRRSVASLPWPRPTPT